MNLMNLNKVIIGLVLVIPLILIIGCWPFDPIEREGLGLSFGEGVTTQVVNQVDVSQNEVTVTVSNNGDSTSTIERYSFKYYYDGGPRIPDLDRAVTQTFDITSGSTKEVKVNVAPWEVITYAKAHPLRQLRLRITFAGTGAEIYGDFTLIFYHTGIIYFENPVRGGATVIVEDIDLSTRPGAGNDKAYVTLTVSTGVTFPGGTLIILNESSTEEGKFSGIVGWSAESGTTVTITATYDDAFDETGSAPTTNPTVTYSYVE